RGSEMLNAFRAQCRSQRSGRSGGVTAQVAVEKSAGPGVARTRGIDYVGNFNGLDAVELLTLRHPSAVFAYFHRADTDETGQTPRLAVVRFIRPKERANLIFIGEHDVDTF